MIHCESLSELKEYINKNPFSLVYISSKSCNVCKSLFPKIESIAENFPEIKIIFAEINSIPEIAGEFLIFTVPTIVFFIEGKEYIRESRYVHTEELYKKIEKFFR